MKAEIFGASWCIYCKDAVKLCETNSIQFSYIDVDDADNLNVLEEKMGGKVKSVPQIFLDDQYVPGGFLGLKRELAKYLLESK